MTRAEPVHWRTGCRRGYTWPGRRGRLVHDGARLDSIARGTDRPRPRVHHVPLDSTVVTWLRRAGVELIGATTLAPELFRTRE